MNKGLCQFVFNFAFKRWQVKWKLPIHDHSWLYNQPMLYLQLCENRSLSGFPEIKWSQVDI
jgi:hypothetical protein